jgi:hypothetical protein
MTYLFEQLGLDASQEAIAQFIEQHQLAAHVDILAAEFWNASQRAFLEEKMGSDGEWHSQPLLPKYQHEQPTDVVQ